MTWTLAVLLLMNSRLPIWVLVRSWATSRRTAVSRGVSPYVDGGVSMAFSGDCWSPRSRRASRASDRISARSGAWLWAATAASGRDRERGDG